MTALSKLITALHRAKRPQPSIFRALRGYPFLPCPICADEGYPGSIEGCDHTVLERATRTHPGLAISKAGGEQ